MNEQASSMAFLRVFFVGSHTESNSLSLPQAGKAMYGTINPSSAEQDSEAAWLKWPISEMVLLKWRNDIVN